MASKKFGWCNLLLPREWGYLFNGLGCGLIIILIILAVLFALRYLAGVQVKAEWFFLLLAAVLGPLVGFILLLFKDKQGTKVRNFRFIPWLIKSPPHTYIPKILVFAHSEYRRYFHSLFSPYFNVDFGTTKEAIKNDHDCVFVLADTRYYTDKGGAGGFADEGIRKELENRISEYLRIGGRLVCTHDFHGFFAHVGTFGPPYTRVEIYPNDFNHPICKGIKKIVLEEEEASQREDYIQSEDTHKMHGFRGAKVLLRFFDSLNTEGLGANTYDAAWLVKWHKDYWNIFYSYFNHNPGNVTNEHLGRLWVNAISYLTSRKESI